MFKNILVATDGSDLAAKAVEEGILFAKEVGAKITALTVTEPSNVLSLAPGALEYIPIEYKKYAEAYAEEVLGTVSAKAQSAGVTCETLTGVAGFRRLSLAVRRSKCSRTRKYRFLCIGEGVLGVGWGGRRIVPSRRLALSARNQRSDDLVSASLRRRVPRS